jgi:exopolysaccharide biosynthesis polyprenyl glycosylphosphotransferase
MLRRDRLIRMQIHELMDACLFAVSFWLAYVLRSNLDVIDLLNLPVIDSSDRYNYVWLYLLLIPAAPMILEAQGFYNRPLLCPRATTAWMLFKGCVFTTLGLVLTLFLFRIEIARFVIIWFGCISFILVFIKEELLSVLLHSKVAQAQYRRRFILVAAADQTARLAAELVAAKSHTDIDVLAQIDLNHMPVKRLVEMLHEHSVNGVLLDVNNFSRDRVEEALHACELEGVEVWIAADFFRPQISRVSLDDFLGRPILVFRSTPETSWQSVAKQVFDFFGAAIALVIAIPFLFLPIALVIKLTSPGPVFFKQKRSGLNGRPFTLYKFRTMVTNAEQFQQELAAMNEMSGPVFKVTNDPRITPIGRWLRRSSLDELPQLYNVLRGEMSLVGPRPLPVDEVKRFNDLAHRRRLSVRPGLTCLWQISGRNNVKDFKDWVRLDLEYIDNWSLWLDFKILCLTVPVVLVGTGAK